MNKQKLRKIRKAHNNIKLPNQKIQIKYKNINNYKITACKNRLLKLRNWTNWNKNKLSLNRNIQNKQKLINACSKITKNVN